MFKLDDHGVQKPMQGYLMNFPTFSAEMFSKSRTDHEKHIHISLCQARIHLQFSRYNDFLLFSSSGGGGSSS